MAVRIWYGTEADVYIQEVGSGAAFQAAHQRTCQITEYGVSGGDRDVETLHVMGEELTAPCVSILKEMPQEEFEVEFTMIKNDVEGARWVLGGTDVVEPILIVGAGPRLTQRIIIDMKKTPAGGTEHNLRIIATDAYGVTIEKSQDAEGNIEETITFKCAAANYSEEYTSNTGTAPLPTPASY